MIDKPMTVEEVIASFNKHREFWVSEAINRLEAIYPGYSKLKSTFEIEKLARNIYADKMQGVIGIHAMKILL